MSKGTFDPLWEELHAEREWGRYPSEETVRFVCRRLKKLNKKGLKVLDLGCGGGAISWLVSREGLSAYGFDGSLNAAKRARKLVLAEGRSGEFFQADAGILPLKSGCFDSIIDSAAITANTTAGIRQILSECRRVLTLGGLFFSTGLFSPETTGFNTGEKIETNTFRNVTEGALAGTGTVHFFTQPELEAILKESGFGGLVCDKMTRTDSGGKTVISYWFVEAMAC